ncbi:phosphoglucomutase/phosphomannomutase family protein [Lyngbya confervoides]|uniref:phosphoglucomutase (alpha-D-glucose-1,6-bisphosphate-dependent) n=1 Tax=Lyngbya confervoides BDU141951 TaxID=1574623 RepID=A0ABD4T2N8_9CYAN|nr:phosphoglucomutase/phosphomannomutase family protein [Lyngbya confervoides]MCM1982710.1 phosphoglucomutase/phosphomannomutase family protein [Lyngbya confervoides BDU141951]
MNCVTDPGYVRPLLQPIQFGTDGWRGIIAQEFTFERLAWVAPIAAQILERVYGASVPTRTVIVGYDRRFLSEDFAQAVAVAVQQAGYDVLLSDTYAPTPALSWAVKHREALGALVITASHNPGTYSGLKVKGAFGGSVPEEVTQLIQAELATITVPIQAAVPGRLEFFNPWPEYCEVLRTKVKVSQICRAVESGKLAIFVDAMHGATGSGMAQVLGCEVHELRGDRDPLFGGSPPEPLAKYIGGLMEAVRRHREKTGALTVGVVFDGDGDRIAAVDGNGKYLSSQILIPILIDHFAANRGLRGEVIKTVSGSDLMPRVAQMHHLPVFETPIGYKYIADRMLQVDSVLLGGEESGGIGFGTHIPERDGLLSALYLLEAIAEREADLSELFAQLQDKTQYYCHYDRIDLHLSGDEAKDQLIHQLEHQPFSEILGQSVQDVSKADGFKFRLADQSWLLVRFSGTEPVLRLYCEAATLERVHEILNWAKAWALGTDTP